MNDALELLDELQDLLDLNTNNSGLADVWVLQDFIDSQRSIYSGGRGECAA